MYVHSLTEKTDELKKCKEEFESKQTELNSEVEKLKYDNERCVTYIHIAVIFICMYAYVCTYVCICIIYVCM